jgi:heptosyltransferase-1
MMTPSANSPPRRILVIRVSAIGDVIMSSGLLPILSRAWPSAEISWLTDDTNAGLLVANPRLEEVITLPRRHWQILWRAGQYRRLSRELRNFARELRGRHFDLAIDLQGLLKSAVWARLAGAPQRIGLGSREGSQWLMTRVVSRRVKSDLLGKEYRALAEALGLDSADYAMDVVVGPADEQEAAAILREARVAAPYAVFAPFTTRPQKHWFDDRWVALGAEMAALGLGAVVLGGPGDRAHGEALVSAAPAGSLVSLAGCTTLRQAAVVIRDARLMVGVDTGLTHLGYAMCTPTIALFGSTRPYLDPGVPVGCVLYEPMDCSPCRRRPTCGGAFTCMRRHTVDEVLAAADALLRASS